MKFVIVESYGMNYGGGSCKVVAKECECCGARTEVGFFRSQIDAETYCELMNEPVVIIEPGKKL